MKLLILTLIFIAFLTFPTRSSAYFTSFTTISGNSLGFTDWTAPKTTAYVVNQEEKRRIQEVITNGDFIDGLYGWQTTDNVVVSEKTAVLGSPIQTSEHTSSLEQIIPNTVQTLVFRYQLLGGDEQESLAPVFTVFVNEKPMYQTAQRTPESVSIPVDLSGFTGESLRISFSLEYNPLISTTPYTLKLFSVTTREIAMNLHTQFSFFSEDRHTPATYYRLSETQHFSFLHPFSLHPQKPTDVLSFWSEDPSQNVESSQTIPVHFDEQIPEVSLLSLWREPNNEAVIKLEILQKNQCCTQNVDVRISDTKIDEYADIDSLPHAVIAPESMRAFAQQGEENIFLNEIVHDEPYSIALRVKDSFGNISKPVIGIL